MNLAALAENSLQRLGERMSLAFEDERLTNVQIMDRARRFQSALTEFGIRGGDHVVMFMVNHHAVHSVFQGIFRTGAAAVPVMFQVTPAELRYVLNDTKARAVITDSTVLYKVREAVKGLDFIEWVAVRGGKDLPDAKPPEYSLESLFAREATDQIAQIDDVGSSRVDLQACKLEYSIVSPK